MNDPRIDKLARVLVRYSVDVQEGDLVVISAAPTASPLVTAAYREVLLAGGHPWVRMTPDACGEIFFKHAQDHQLRFLNPLDKQIIEKADVTMGFWAGENTKALSRVDPAKQAVASKARMAVTSGW